MLFCSLKAEVSHKDSRFPVTKWYFDHLMKMFLEGSVGHGFLEGTSINVLLSDNYRSE